VEAAVWVVHSDLRGTSRAARPSGGGAAAGAVGGVWGLPLQVGESMDVVSWFQARDKEEDIIAHTLDGSGEYMSL